MEEKEAPAYSSVTFGDKTDEAKGRYSQASCCHDTTKKASFRRRKLTFSIIHHPAVNPLVYGVNEACASFDHCSEKYYHENGEKPRADLFKDVIGRNLLRKDIRVESYCDEIKEESGQHGYDGCTGSGDQGLFSAVNKIQGKK